MRSPSSLGHFYFFMRCRNRHTSHAFGHILVYRPVRTVTGLIISKTTGFNFNTHSFERVTKKTGFMVVSTRMYRIGTYISDTNVL